MTTAPAPRVELDESIRRDPALAARAEQAVERLRGRGASVGDGTTFHWRVVPGDDAWAELSITEPGADGPVTARNQFPARHLADQFGVDRAVRSVWDDVLATRIDRSIRRTARELAMVADDDPAQAQESAHAP